MMAFTDYPDQWELFKAQRPKTAADEIIRWATPITAFQRTALINGIKGWQVDYTGNAAIPDG